MKVGCKEKLVSDKITLDIRSPFNFHAKTAQNTPENPREREEGYTVELCYQCTNGFDTASVDNFRVVVQGDECLKEDTLTNTTKTDTGLQKTKYDLERTNTTIFSYSQLFSQGAVNEADGLYNGTYKDRCPITACYIKAVGCQGVYQNSNLLSVDQTTGNFEIIANTTVGVGWSEKFCYVCENRGRTVTRDNLSVAQE